MEEKIIENIENVEETDTGVDTINTEHTAPIVLKEEEQYVGTHPETWEDVHISVYTICKNESKFTKDWIENMWCDGHGANKVYVLDTGSSDNTVASLVESAKEVGAPDDWLVINVKPYTEFRFDVARNDNMKMIDEKNTDVLYCIDLDEKVIEDFWSDLRHMVFEHPMFDRIYYRYAWSHNSDGTPGIVFWYDKITKPYWRWRYPVHECLYNDGIWGYTGQYYMDGSKIYLHHYMDMTKSRGSYIGLLEKRRDENKNDVYGRYYLAREYAGYGKYSKAIEVATELYLMLTDEGNESYARVDDMHMLPCICTELIGRSFDMIGNKSMAQAWYCKGIEYDKKWRGSYIRCAASCSYSGQVRFGFDILRRMDESAVDMEDWRFSSTDGRVWRRKQIEANLYCWDGNEEECKRCWDAAVADFRCESDGKEAAALSFYSDYEFSRKKYGWSEKLPLFSLEYVLD